MSVEMMMSTSDIQVTLWKPDELSGRKSELQISSRVDEKIAVDPNQEAIQQAEYLRACKEAEHNGFLKGQLTGEEAGRKLGYAEGYQQGKEEGYKQGKEELELREQLQYTQFSQLLHSFHESLDSLDSFIPSRLTQISLMAVSYVYSGVLNCESSNELLLTRIKKLLKEDSLLKGKFKLWISNEEPDSLFKQIESILCKYDWELHMDPHMKPGGCRITTEEGELDASIENRWESLCHLFRKGEGS
ncbi:TPA: FliH/SctL family protein [Salmonella enterica subsp. enterica serovar Muenchen]|nr:flagellar assembly protein FliH [Salmonella enterica]EJH1054362.1 flagellar assembly protein FliH [Salmonella enterica]HEC7758623.1 flagellar assembly protein FliH [Salmonella enterica subsp. enterica serovar Muenchen]HEC8860519.1 flagellar assembly protein FliH [Salmonella enterica subsp. enterica serovar Muenchen]